MSVSRARMNTRGTLRYRVTDNHVDRKDKLVDSVINADDSVDSIHPEDNWIACILYGSKLGLTVNFAFLAICTLNFIISLPHKIQVYDDRFHLLVTVVDHFFRYALPFDGFIILFILSVFYPLTCVTRSTKYLLILSCICSVSIYTMLAFYYQGIVMNIKLLMVIDCTRFTMKLFSYSIECYSSKQVYTESSMKTFLYFLHAPTLIYRPKYPMTRQIRWVKVIGNFWWLCVICIIIGEYYYYHLQSVFTFDMASGSLTSRLTNIFTLYFNITLGYLFVIWFAVFENFCGLHGELLRFPYLKLFGELGQCVQGEKLASQVNIIVSDWLSRYIYKPVRVKTQSRAQALTAAIAVSLFLHEVCGSFTFRTFLPLPYLIWIVIGPMTLYLQVENKLIKYSIALIFAHMIPLYLFGHPLEYIARNHSSCDTRSFSSISIFPLYPSCLLYNL